MVVPTRASLFKNVAVNAKNKDPRRRDDNFQWNFEERSMSQLFHVVCQTDPLKMTFSVVHYPFYEKEVEKRNNRKISEGHLQRSNESIETKQKTKN